MWDLNHYAFLEGIAILAIFTVLELDALKSKEAVLRFSFLFGCEPRYRNVKSHRILLTRWIVLWNLFIAIGFFFLKPGSDLLLVVRIALAINAIYLLHIWLSERVTERQATVLVLMKTWIYILCPSAAIATNILH